MSCARAKISMEACEGATFEKSFVWKAGDPPVEVDLTGYTGACHVRDSISDETPVFDLQLDAGFFIKDQGTDPGGYFFRILDSETSNTCPKHKSRRMVYDLRLVSPEGEVKLQQYGDFTIYPAVTRPWQQTP